MQRGPRIGLQENRELRMGRTVVALACLAALTLRQDADERVTTTSKGHATHYVARTLEHFKVWVDERLLGPEKALGDEALKLLGMKLYDVTRAVREPALARLQQVPLWLSLDDPCRPCACFHESPEWLAENGFDPQKGKAVEICNAKNFLAWTHEQPWMVLHELAHAFEDREFAAADPRRTELERLFTQAQRSGKYDSVLVWNGSRAKHYAVTDAKEYFAEGTEAWLGVNDFEPFVAAELKQFDPELAAFLEKVWGARVTSDHLK
jgi:hypothetical protein